MAYVNPKTVVQCDYFGKGDTLYFNCGRIAELEELLERPLVGYLKSEVSIKFLATAYMVALSHRHPTYTLVTYMNKFDELIERQGLGIEELAMPIITAIARSGFLGKTVAERALDKAPKGDGKNGGKV